MPAFWGFGRRVYRSPRAEAPIACDTTPGLSPANTPLKSRSPCEAHDSQPPRRCDCYARCRSRRWSRPWLVLHLLWAQPALAQAVVARSPWMAVGLMPSVVTGHSPILVLPQAMTPARQRETASGIAWPNLDSRYFTLVAL